MIKRIRHSIHYKLTLSYLAIAILTALLIYGLTYFIGVRQVRDAVHGVPMQLVAQDVADIYSEYGSLDNAEKHLIAQIQQRQTDRPSGGSDMLRPLDAGRPSGGDATPPGKRQQGAARARFLGVVDAETSQVILPFDLNEAGSVVSLDVYKWVLPVEVDRQVVAYVISSQTADTFYSEEERIFLERINRALLISVVLGVGGSLLMGGGLARVLLRPIQDLIAASRAMAQGDLKQQVEVRTQDEIGELATSFNKMSHDLAHSIEQRRQLIANIAHDLGTPLQLISGHVELLEDGEMELSPRWIGALSTEVEHLRQLIRDLEVLVQADNEMLPVDLEPIAADQFLAHVQASYGPIVAKRSIQFETDVPSALPHLVADRVRLMQVVGNLINNALRYTPTEGTIKLKAETKNEHVILSVCDTGRGIAPDILPHIFDRFYRGDQSRSDGGKMGLGLAICKTLVDAMGGDISAESIPNQETTFRITLKSA